jgi:MFS family permease
MSSAGSALASFAVVLQVYDLTRSPVAVGMLGVAQLVPTLAVGLLAGPVTDVTDRRKLVLATSGCLAAVSAVLAAQALAGPGTAWALYALTAAQSALSAVDSPARGTFVTSLLPANQLAAGLALNRLSFQITLTVGPALAGLIAAAPHLGLPACYLIDTVSFTAALYGIARLPSMPPQSGVTRPGLRAAAEGTAFIRRSPLIAGAFLADLTATVFGLPAALFPAINAERFGGDPRTLGLFTTAIGLGGLASAAFSGLVTHVSRQGRAMLCAVAVWGAAITGFAVAPSLWLTLSLLATAGAADTFTVVFRGAIVAAATPGHLLGRVMAADHVIGAGGGQLGNLEAGTLGSLTSPMISAVTGGLVTVAGAAMIGLALPAFTRHRRNRPEAPPPAPSWSPSGTCWPTPPPGSPISATATTRTAPTKTASSATTSGRSRRC